jgi:hypothetical protein
VLLQMIARLRLFHLKHSWLAAGNPYLPDYTSSHDFLTLPDSSSRRRHASSYADDLASMLRLVLPTHPKPSTLDPGKRLGGCIDSAVLGRTLLRAAHH